MKYFSTPLVKNVKCGIIKKDKQILFFPTRFKMSQVFDDKLKRKIESTLQAIDGMMPTIRQEIRAIKNDKSNSEQRIERTLDILLDYLHWGFGEEEFKELNHYYAVLDEEKAGRYNRFFTQITEEEIVDTDDYEIVETGPLWLDIQREPTVKIKQFMTALFETEIPGSWFRFDKVDLREFVTRRPDTGMTHRKFIQCIQDSRLVRLDINKKEPYPDNPRQSVNVISLFVACVQVPGIPGIERLARHFTPIDYGFFKNHPNYKIVNELFKKVFNRDMESYAAP